VPWVRKHGRASASGRRSTASQPESEGWVEHMKMIMNEYRLNLGQPEAQEFLLKQWKNTLRQRLELPRNSSQKHCLSHLAPPWPPSSQPCKISAGRGLVHGTFCSIRPAHRLLRGPRLTPGERRSAPLTLRVRCSARLGPPLPKPVQPGLVCAVTARTPSYTGATDGAGKFVLEGSFPAVTLFLRGAPVFLRKIGLQACN
jgi:hypothetical protein